MNITIIKGVIAILITVASVMLINIIVFGIMKYGTFGYLRGKAIASRMNKKSLRKEEPNEKKSQTVPNHV